MNNCFGSPAPKAAAMGTCWACIDSMKASPGGGVANHASLRFVIRSIAWSRRVRCFRWAVLFWFAARFVFMPNCFAIQSMNRLSCPINGTKCPQSLSQIFGKFLARVPEHFTEILDYLFWSEMAVKGSSFLTQGKRHPADTIVNIALFACCNEQLLADCLPKIFFSDLLTR